ncbi:MAG: hypothetical protein JWN20_2836 [Jatrophihabitantaceae bacterium]|nr:hypothetical protein [Jatrophihabitantaceae bacterium]
MDIYWSVILAVAGVGAALLVALLIASALLLGPWYAGKTALLRRRATAGPANSATSADASPSDATSPGAAASPSVPTGTMRLPRARAA